MPRVPVQETPSVASAPLNPRMQAPLGPVGFGDIASGLGGLAAGLGMAAEAHKKASEAEATKLETQLDAAATDYYFNAQTGAFNQHGEEGFQAPDRALGQLQKTRDDLAASAGSEDTRQAFLNRAELMLESYRRKGESYKANEFRVVQLAAADDRQKVSLDALAHWYADPMQRERLMAQPVDAIRAIAPSQEAGDTAVAEFRKHASQVVLNSYIQARDLAGAKDFYAQARDELGDAAPQFNHEIQQLDIAQTGSTLATQIIDGSRMPGTGWVDEGKVRTALGSLPATVDPAMKAEVLRMGEAFLGNELHRVEADRNQHFQAALTAAEQTGTVPPIEKAWLIRNAPLDYLRLAAAVKKEDGGATPQQQAASWSFQALAAEHPDQVAAMDDGTYLRTWRSIFSKHDAKAMDGIFFDLKKGKGTGSGGNGEGSLVGPLVPRLLLNTAKAAFGEDSTNPDNWTQDHFQALYTASADVQAQLEDFRRANGKAAPPEQVKTWVAQKFLDGTIPGTGSLFDRHATAIEAEAASAPWEPAWTADQKELAASALKAAGLQPSKPAVDRYLHLKYGAPGGSVVPAKDLGLSVPSGPAGRVDREDMQLARDQAKSMGDRFLLPNPTPAPRELAAQPPPAAVPAPDPLALAEIADAQQRLLEAAALDQAANEAANARAAALSGVGTPQAAAAAEARQAALQTAIDTVEERRATARSLKTHYLAARTRREREAQLREQGVPDAKLQAQLKQEGY